ncbi:MAG: GNAT family N-acetyltransferase [Candidatus Kaelpia aquatica]|nr:GNAT family N-acetyltransferase [Candidatus Kaelpia aquatica]
MVNLKTKGIVLFIVGAILLSPPACARRVHNVANLEFLNEIDWQKIQTAIDEAKDRLYAEFSGSKRWVFTEALHESMRPETEEKSFFVLEQMPTNKDLEYIRDLELDHEISILFIPYIDTWFLVRGNGTHAELPDNLDKIYRAGLVGSFGHLHYSDFWPLPSPVDVDMAITYGGFEWVIAGSGICIYEADDITNPLTGNSWLLNPYKIKDFLPKISTLETEDEALSVVSEFYKTINLDFTILLWIELENDSIAGIDVLPDLVESLHSPDDITRARALVNVASLLDEEALVILKSFSNDPSVYIRTLAIELISNMDLIDAKEAIDTAEAYLDDADFSIKSDALDIVIQLSQSEGLLEELKPAIIDCLKKTLNTEHFLSTFRELSSLRGVTDNPELLASAVSEIGTEDTIKDLHLIVDTAERDSESQLALYCLDFIDNRLPFEESSHQATARMINPLEGARLTFDDCQKISNLGSETIKDANDGKYLDLQIDLILRDGEPIFIQTSLQNSYGILYEQNGELIGCGFIEQERDGWNIKSFFVAPQMQGNGIGTKIIEELERIAISNGATKIYLEAYDFPNTISFYEKAGYTITGRTKPFRRFDLARAIDFISMEKTINDERSD